MIMKPIISFQDLVVWQKAMDLADLTYSLTERFPPHERYGLSMQMRKAAVSIASNIAEGHRRRRPGFIHHVEIALGSHAELQTQSILAYRRCFIAKVEREQLDLLLAEVGRLTHGLLRSLETPS